MNNNYYIHPSYKTNETLRLVSSLIYDYSCQSFDDVSPSDKYKLAGLLSIADGATDDLSFLSGSPFSQDILSLFRRYTTRPNANNAEAFLESLKEAYIDHYSPTMEKLFNYVMENYRSDIEANIDHTRKYGDEDAAYDNYISNNL
jgi:hypothetical protein